MLKEIGREEGIHKYLLNFSNKTTPKFIFIKNQKYNKNKANEESDSIDFYSQAD